jgi:hypothetical protein
MDARLLAIGKKEDGDEQASRSSWCSCGERSAPAGRCRRPAWWRRRRFPWWRRRPRRRRRLPGGALGGRGWPVRQFAAGWPEAASGVARSAPDLVALQDASLASARASGLEPEAIVRLELVISAGVSTTAPASIDTAAVSPATMVGAILTIAAIMAGAIHTMAAITDVTRIMAATTATIMVDGAGEPPGSPRVPSLVPRQLRLTLPIRLRYRQLSAAIVRLRCGPAP